MRERIGSYRIEKVLAEGGMGLVYKGRHERLGRDAAIKTLLPKNAGDAAFRQRLLREAQAQARLQHPNIVAVYDLIDEHDELFIAMEYVEGETLAALLDHSPRARLTIVEALALFEQVLDALAYVHSEQIIHRDVKPSNVMVCGSRVKLADFGIALLNDTPRLTASLHVIGSPPYMSPEQLQAKSIDHRSDIYSAAVVLYRMVSGRLPFEAKEYLAQIHERAIGPPDLRTYASDLPVGVCEAVAIALRYEPGERFHSVAAFRESLCEGAVGFLVPAPPPAEEEQETEIKVLPAAIEPRPRKPAVLVGFVVAGSVAAATFVFQSRVDQQPFPEAVPSRRMIVERTIPAPVFVETPAPAVLPPKPEPPKIDPVKVAPFPPKTEPAEDKEAKRRRVLDALREAIRAGLARAENDLGLERFENAIGELDGIAAMAQRDPDLKEEHAEIAQLRTRVTNARLAALTRDAQDALWASRLAEVEEDLRAERWPEAERFAKDIADDPRAPDAIAARARALLQQAKEGFRNAFSDTTLGANSNKIRKPSSPPRKEN